MSKLIIMVNNHQNKTENIIFQKFLKKIKKDNNCQLKDIQEKMN